MKIQRMHTYRDSRFSQEVLYQHGAFLVDGRPWEIEITGKQEAVIRGGEPGKYAEVIEEFRFYTPHITRFFHENGEIIQEFPVKELLTLPLEQIQPSQFYVDEEKVAAVGYFLHESEDIIIQAMPYDGRYISLDGHTRLYYACQQGWETVQCVVEPGGEWSVKFALDAQNRKIFTPKDLRLVTHGEYEVKWNAFCDQFFAQSD